jgi:hypothetical protein
MDAKYYHKILVSAMKNGEEILGKGFYFQQDNDPKHTAKLNKNYLETKESNGDCTMSLVYCTSAF